MAYTMLKRENVQKNYSENPLKQRALLFIRNRCEGLRFDKNRVTGISNKNAEELDFDGKSIKSKQIPYNMEKDIDRLCLENAIERFLKTGKKEDALDVYFCFLEMFVGDYKKTRRMIELLSEFEANGSGLLMKHRDHYSHSVYVFCLGLAIYESNDIYRETYKSYCKKENENEAACHYLQYWGLASLFHDIGYPFELPFEQVCSYFEVEGVERNERPFVAYHGLDVFTKLNKTTQRKLGKEFGLGTDKILQSTDELFAYALHKKLGSRYYFSEEEMLCYLMQKPTKPDKFGHFMDHAYFSATVLFKKLFEDVKIDFEKEWSISNLVDSLTAIILHNSLYKFSVAFYKNPDANMRLKAEWHPLAYMLMLCDELQCWDRTAYGRNSKIELHPMDCKFEFGNDTICATYIFDEEEKMKINNYDADKKTNKKAKLKAYSSYDRTTEIIRDDESHAVVCEFQADIENIVDLSKIHLKVDKSISKRDEKKKTYLSDSNFINLYNFATILHGMWGNVNEWKKDKEEGCIERFLSNEKRVDELRKSFGEISLEYKLYNINQAKGFAKYLDKIGCFYTDKNVDCEKMVDKFDAVELEKIGVLEHQRWLQEHYDMGWVYAEERNEIERQHDDMIPQFFEEFEVSYEVAKANYERLSKGEQSKDTDPMECMLAMLKLFDGLRIYRLN